LGVKVGPKQVKTQNLELSLVTPAPQFSTAVTVRWKGAKINGTLNDKMLIQISAFFSALQPLNIHILIPRT
jgi:hypothetical protein